MKYILRISTFLAVFVILGVGFIDNYKSKNNQIAGVHTSINESTVRGLILPHHGIASELIQESFERIKYSQYSYIVIIGPNHFVPDASSIISTLTLADNNIESDFLQKMKVEYPGILFSEDITANEHSITLHLPYIKNYFPGAGVIPLIVSPFAGNNELVGIVEYLTSVLPDDTLFIASVDFAHNVMVETGINNNNISIEAIRSFDYKTIMRFNDEFMDSPLSISMLLKAMQIFETTNWETWYNSHGAVLENDPRIQGTSYVIGVFR
jgi:MEMO1 family protein